MHVVEILASAVPAHSASKLTFELADGTRRSLLRTLQEQGPLTAAALASHLGLTPQAVRRHLDGLLTTGEIQGHDPGEGPVRGRGRPARRFALTARGRDALGNAYDALALDALRFLAATGGEEAIATFARQRAESMAARYRPQVAGVPAEEQVSVLADLLTGDGYASVARGADTPASEADVLCQHHCPVSRVAAEFPQLCAAETEMIGDLLARSTVRQETIAAGNVSCLTYVAVGSPRNGRGQLTRSIPRTTIPGNQESA